MDVIVAGACIPPNPSDLLESDTMAQLLRRVAGDYDFVIIDAPPGVIVSDTFPLMREVGGVIIVSNVRKASRDAAERLRDQLEKLGAPLLGVVVNNAKRAGEAYYGYPRRRKATTVRSSSTADRASNGASANGAPTEIGEAVNR